LKTEQLSAENAELRECVAMAVQSLRIIHDAGVTRTTTVRDALLALRAEYVKWQSVRVTVEHYMALGSAIQELDATLAKLGLAAEGKGEKR